MIVPAGCRETWGCWKKLPDQLKIFFIWETTAVKFDFEGSRQTKNQGAVQ